MARTLMVGAWLAAVVSMLAASAEACPFCSAQSQTLSEELKGADAAVIARLVGPADIKTSAAKLDGAGPPDAESRRTRFDIVEVLKGEKLVAGKSSVEVLYFGDQLPGAMFYILG